MDAPSAITTDENLEGGWPDDSPAVRAEMRGQVQRLRAIESQVARFADSAAELSASLAALKAYQNMPAARARNIKDSVGEALWVTGDAQRKAEMSKQNRRVRKVRGFACVCILPDSVLTVVLRVDARRIFARPTTSPTLTAPPSSQAGGATSPQPDRPHRP